MVATFDFCDVAKGKQANREELIPQEWRASPSQIEESKAQAKSKGKPKEWALLLPQICLTPDEVEITESSANHLLKKLWQDKTVSARQVCEAFCKRAVLAHQVTNCFTEICFEEALRAAEQLDEDFEQTKKQAGPLAGLPISIKDNFNMKGLDSTLGFVVWANDPAQSESLLIRILREQGAILFCKTNVPVSSKKRM